MRRRNIAETRSEKWVAKERRRFRRLRVRQRVFFGIDSLEYVGSTVDVSMGGLHIASMTPMPRGTKIMVGFGQDLENIETRVRGRVVWLIREASPHQRISNHHMGVELTWLDEHYLKYLAKLIDQNGQKAFPAREDRGSVRYEHQVEVIFEEMGEILQQISKNISKGGIFVCTDQPYEPGTFVTLRIVIPHILEEVRARGQVAHRVELADAVKKGCAPGMGIKFLEFAPGDGRRFASFIKRLAVAYQKVNAPIES